MCDLRAEDSAFGSCVAKIAQDLPCLTHVRSGKPLLTHKCLALS
jgi:hypothetical protein